MRIKKTPRNMLALGAVAGVVLTAAVAFAAARATQPEHDKFSELMRKDGFDFTTLRAPGKEWRGPEAGERIDLSRLRGADGRTLAERAGGRPLMLAAVDPSCGMCKAATDMMRGVRGGLTPLGTPYYVVSFVPVEGDFYKYAASLGVGDGAFLWASEEAPPPDSCLKAVQPSHILVSADGAVLRVWPGANPVKAVRERMGTQIVSDASAIIEALDAIARADKPPAAVARAATDR